MSILQRFRYTLSRSSNIMQASRVYVFEMTSLPNIFKFKYVRVWHVIHHVYSRAFMTPSVFCAWINREVMHFSPKIPDNCENSVCWLLGTTPPPYFLPESVFVVACQVQYFPKTRPVPQNHWDPELQMGHQCEGQSFLHTTDGAISLLGFSAVARILKFDLMYG